MIKNLLDVFRPLRWYRNLFMLAGSFLAIKILNINFIDLSSGDLFKVLVTFLSTCLVASGNYGINEVLDAKSDSFHPEKKNRAIPSGKISPNLVIVISVFLYISGFFFVSKLNNLPLFLSIFLLFISGIFYNVKPIRLKDLPYLDFLSEAANNPIRLLIGWYAIAKPHQLVPSSFILSFWFLGVFLMAAKRFGETNKRNLYI
jgi:decaprenyl-phosphate phosphoribosyltransferase